MPAYMCAGGRGSEDEIVWNRDDGSGSCDGSCRSRSREETAPGSGDWGFRDECESPGGSGSGAACQGLSCLAFFFRLKPFKHQMRLRARTCPCIEFVFTSAHTGGHGKGCRGCHCFCTPVRVLRLNMRIKERQLLRLHARTHARTHARLKLEAHREMEEVWMGAASDLLSLRGETGSGAAASGGVTARSVFVFFESGRPGA